MYRTYAPQSCLWSRTYQAPLRSNNNSVLSFFLCVRHLPLLDIESAASIVLQRNESGIGVTFWLAYAAGERKETMPSRDILWPKKCPECDSVGEKENKKQKRRSRCTSSPTRSSTARLPRKSPSSGRFSPTRTRQVWNSPTWWEKNLLRSIERFSILVATLCSFATLEHKGFYYLKLNSFLLRQVDSASSAPCPTLRTLPSSSVVLREAP